MEEKPNNTSKSLEDDIENYTPTTRADVIYTNVRAAGKKISNPETNQESSQFIDNAKNVGKKVLNKSISGIKTTGKALGTGVGVIGGSFTKVAGDYISKPAIRSNQALTGGNASYGSSDILSKIASLPPTPAQRRGAKGRPQTKVVIKKSGLKRIGGTNQDFERLITFENLTEGKVPMPGGGYVTTAQPRAVGRPSNQIPTGILEQQKNAYKIKTLTNGGRVNIEGMRELTSSPHIDRNNLNNITSSEREQKIQNLKSISNIGSDLSQQERMNKIRIKILFKLLHLK